MFNRLYCDKSETKNEKVRNFRTKLHDSTFKTTNLIKQTDLEQIIFRKFQKFQDE